MVNRLRGPLAAEWCVVWVSLVLLAPLTPSRSHAVVGGELDRTSSWVVGVGGAKPRCSGTLIAPRLVLTAAHCVRLEEDGLRVFVARGGEPMRAVSINGFRVHPNFDAVTLANDVALLQLAKDEGLEPLPLAETAPAVGARVTVVGFGDAEDGQRGVRRAGSMEITQVRATTLEAAPGPAAACGFDSGGAVVADGKLVGVISGGDFQCKKLAVFSRIDAHRAFIDSGNKLLSTEAPASRGEARHGDWVVQLVFALAWVLLFAVHLRRRAAPDAVQGRGSLLLALLLLFSVNGLGRGLVPDLYLRLAELVLNAALWVVFVHVYRHDPALRRPLDADAQVLSAASRRSRMAGYVLVAASLATALAVTIGRMTLLRS